MKRFFDKENWQTRKQWWTGTKQMAGILVCWTNIFPWLFAVRHPIKAWRYRNMYLEIPGVTDQDCGDPLCEQCIPKRH